jgi:prepilin-type N-terminal cleavage/methylation domain-containing protein
MHRTGFTLAELLVSLTILALIAVFAIPKVLQSQQDAKFKSIGKETAGTISQALVILKSKGLANANTGMNELMPYINHVRLDTSTIVDWLPTLTSRDCSDALQVCYLLHNGAILRYPSAGTARFNGTGQLNALLVEVDPDGKYSGNTTGPGKALQLAIYYDGKIRTRGTIEPNTQVNGGVIQPDPTFDPDWFSWD